jgi:hypothetical protein
MTTQSHAFRYAPSWTFQANTAALRGLIARYLAGLAMAYRVVRFGRPITRPAEFSTLYLPAFRRMPQA